MTNWIKYLSLPAVVLIGIVIGTYWVKPIEAKTIAPLKSINTDYRDPFSYEMVDKKTHVHYLVIESSDSKGISITPRLDKNGKLIVK